MLELRKRHLKKSDKHLEGSPFSADLDCKRCDYYAVGKRNGKKVRRSLETTDRQEAARKLLKMKAEAKAPGLARIRKDPAVTCLLDRVTAAGQIDSGGGVSAEMTLSPDSNTLLVTNSWSDTVEIVDLRPKGWGGKWRVT